MNRNLVDPFPKELDNDATAWAYLRQRFPLYFQGVGRLPGELDKPIATTPSAMRAPVECDVVKFAVYMLQDKHYTLADIAEGLTGRREYGGAVFTRVKAVRDFLENTTTTTPEVSLQDDFSEVVAA
jgi:hypothetical protein